MPKFVDKKKAVSFQLVHGKDPFFVNEDGSRTALQVVEPKETAEEKAARIEEQKKYGIFFTDDTNYLEFLKERSDNFMQWPENAVKEIEKRNRKFEFSDLDIDAAMDEDFDFNDPGNELEDNFLELAGGMEASDQAQWTEAGTSGSNYRSSRPTTGRNDFIDRKFGKMFEDFASSEEDEDIHSSLAANSYQLPKYNNTYDEQFEKSKQPLKLDKDEEAIAITKEMARRKNAFKTEYAEVKIENSLQFDSQSIRNTFSNINKRSKTNGPNSKNVLKQQLDGPSINSKLASLSLEDKNQFLEEKKSRKKTFKKIKNEEKRTNQFAFAAEQHRRHKTTRGNKGSLQTVCRAWQ